MLDELKKFDPEIYEAIRNEVNRQHDGLELIASENFVSIPVLEALHFCRSSGEYRARPSQAAFRM
jgi:glycine/serine hydroxymethyltransferase